MGPAWVHPTQLRTSKADQATNIVAAVDGLRGGGVEPLLDALRATTPIASVSSGDVRSDIAM